MNSDVTKRLLMQTMLELSKTMPLKNIRINDITDKVGFCRRVFFYHFSSRKVFLNHIIEFIFSDSRLCDGCQPIKDLFFLICDCIHEQQHFLIQCLSESDLSEKVYEVIERLLLRSVREELDYMGEQDRIDDVVKEWSCIFNTKLFINHILFRLQRDESMNCRQECSKDIRLVRDFFFYIDKKKFFPLKVAFIAYPFIEISEREMRLMDALKQLAKEIPFSRIRVSDIINRADVSRTTFYRDNYSKYELRNRVWLYDILSLLNNAVDSLENINYDRFQKSIVQYYMNNSNLYEEGVVYDEYDSLYYALKYQYDKSIHRIVGKMPLDYEYSGYAVNCIACALTDCVLNPITTLRSSEYRLNRIDSEQFYNLSDALKLMSSIWDKMINVTY